MLQSKCTVSLAINRLLLASKVRARCHVLHVACVVGKVAVGYTLLQTLQFNSFSTVYTDILSAASII